MMRKFNKSSIYYVFIESNLISDSNFIDYVNLIYGKFNIPTSENVSKYFMILCKRHIVPLENLKTFSHLRNINF